jgi:hypothetical protein
MGAFRVVRKEKNTAGLRESLKFDRGLETRVSKGFCAVDKN